MKPRGRVDVAPRATRARARAAILARAVLGEGRVPITAALLLCALVAMPLWNHPPLARAPAVTLGRIWLILTLAALLAEVRRAPGSWRRLRTGVRGPAIPLLAGGMLGAVVVVVSAHSNGCQCSGGEYGFLELEAWTLLALTAVVLQPALAGRLMAAAVIGALAAGVPALAGLRGAGSVNVGTDRLVGSYGNPNFLAATQAFVVPIALAGAWRPGQMIAAASRLAVWRGLAVGALLVLGAVGFLTYSRAGLIALAAGAFVTLMLQLSTRRARLVAIAAGLLAVSVGGLLYSTYNSLRTAADFGTSTSDPGLRDPRSWETIATGLIGAGPARASNPSAGVLSVRAGAPQQGVSYPLPALGAGTRYRLSFTAATSTPPVSLLVGMEDDAIGAGPVTRTVSLSTLPARATLTWTPAAPSQRPRVYFWTSRPAAFTLRALTVTILGGDAGRRPLAITALPTAVSPAGSRAILNRAEAGFVRARQSVLRLAIRAFIHHPLVGIGWERFPLYSARALHAPPIATHDEYTRFAAELGIGGLVAILAVCAAVMWAILRVRRSVLGPALAGMAVAVAISLGFENLLETPSSSLAIALLAAVCVGLAQDRASAGAANLDGRPARAPAGDEARAPTGPQVADPDRAESAVVER